MRKSKLANKRHESCVHEIGPCWFDVVQIVWFPPCTRVKGTVEIFYMAILMPQILV